jgi:hypothetical protein
LSLATVSDKRAPRTDDVIGAAATLLPAWPPMRCESSSSRALIEPELDRPDDSPAWRAASPAPRCASGFSPGSFHETPDVIA